MLFAQELAKRYPSMASVAICLGVTDSDSCITHEQAASITKYVVTASLVLTVEVWKLGCGINCELHQSSGEKSLLMSINNQRIV